MRGMSFAEAQDAFFADFFRLYPIHATEAGNHEHDDRWPDLTEAGKRARLAWLAEARSDLEAADGLSREEEIDRRVLLATDRRAALRRGGARRALLEPDLRTPTCSAPASSAC